MTNQISTDTITILRTEYENLIRAKQIVATIAVVPIYYSAPDVTVKGFMPIYQAARDLLDIGKK